MTQELDKLKEERDYLRAMSEDSDIYLPSIQSRLEEVNKLIEEIECINS